MLILVRLLASLTVPENELHVMRENYKQYTLIHSMGVFAVINTVLTCTLSMIDSPDIHSADMYTQYDR